MAEATLDSKNPVRKNAIKILKKLVDKYDNIKDEKKIAKIIEKSIFKKAKKDAENTGIYIDFSDNGNFIKLYSDTLNTIAINISKDSHVKQKHSIIELLNDEQKLKKIAFMEPNELCPTLWQPIIDEKKHKEDVLNGKYKKKSTNLVIKCPKCKCTDVMITTAQLRGADEATNILGTCNKCGTRFNK